MRREIMAPKRTRKLQLSKETLFDLTTETAPMGGLLQTRPPDSNLECRTIVNYTCGVYTCVACVSVRTC
jgi:hypothetical protein